MKVSKTDLVHPILKVMSAEKTDTLGERLQGDMALWAPWEAKEESKASLQPRAPKSMLIWTLMVLPSTTDPCVALLNFIILYKFMIDNANISFGSKTPRMVYLPVDLSMMHPGHKTYSMTAVRKNFLGGDQASR